MKISVMRSIVIPIEVEAETVEEADVMRTKLLQFLSDHPRLMMAKGKWKIRKARDAE